MSSSLFPVQGYLVFGFPIGFITMLITNKRPVGRVERERNPTRSMLVGQNVSGFAHALPDLRA